MAQSYEEIVFGDRVFPTASGKIEIYSQSATELWGVAPLPGYEPIAEPPDQYPLQLLSPNSKNRIHSQFGNLQIIKQFEPKAVLFLHPGDASDRKILNGEEVEVFNDQGSSKVEVEFDLGLRKGCVVLTNGHWHSDGASPNLFTTGRETDMGHGTAFHDTWIELKKL